MPSEANDTWPGCAFAYSTNSRTSFTGRAAFTASAELAQVTVTPFFFAAIAGATWVISTEGETVLKVLAAGVSRVYTPKDYKLADIMSDIADLVLGGPGMPQDRAS